MFGHDFGRRIRHLRWRWNRKLAGRVAHNEKKTTGQRRDPLHCGVGGRATKRRRKRRNETKRWPAPPWIARPSSRRSCWWPRWWPSLSPALIEPDCDRWLITWVRFHLVRGRKSLMTSSGLDRISSIGTVMVQVYGSRLMAYLINQSANWKAIGDVIRSWSGRFFQKLGLEFFTWLSIVCFKTKKNRPKVCKSSWTKRSWGSKIWLGTGHRIENGRKTPKPSRTQLTSKSTESDLIVLRIWNAIKIT